MDCFILVICCPVLLSLYNSFFFLLFNVFSHYYDKLFFSFKRNGERRLVRLFIFLKMQIKALHMCMQMFACLSEGCMRSRVVMSVRTCVFIGSTTNASLCIRPFVLVCLFSFFLLIYSDACPRVLFSVTPFVVAIRRVEAFYLSILFLWSVSAF